MSGGAILNSPSAYENPADPQQWPPLAGSSPWTLPVMERLPAGADAGTPLSLTTEEYPPGA